MSFKLFTNLFKKRAIVTPLEPLPQYKEEWGQHLALSEYIKTASQFEHTENPRWFKVLSKGVVIGTIWFKWGLGGWNIRFNNEANDVWKVRGPIKNKEQLDKLLLIHG
jgi:hypothetical protein